MKDAWHERSKVAIKLFKMRKSCFDKNTNLVGVGVMCVKDIRKKQQNHMRSWERGPTILTWGWVTS